MLFLDELPEFQRRVLEVLRQPMEDEVVTIARAAMSLTFPARFMLVAAMNPCPCGYYGTEKCQCHLAAVHPYMQRISGPLMDRFDIQLHVPAVAYRELRDKSPGESSAAMRERVCAARDRQTRRFRDDGIYCNARMSSPMIRRHCPLDDAGEAMLEQAIQKMGFSARAHDRILKVARTIADLDDADADRGRPPVRGHPVPQPRPGLPQRNPADPLERGTWLVLIPSCSCSCSCS